MQTIDCRNVDFFRGKKKVLDRISFSLNEGELMGLIGHNGAGKSTLIKLILGLIRPAAGELLIMGGEPGMQPLQIGYLPENVSFYDAMTVREHLDYFAGLKGVSAKRIDELVEELGLGVVISQRLGQCSKGQRQRLGLAQALLSKPRLLLLDEPTVGLDPAASALMYSELSALRDAGCSVVVCTHELALVEPFLDRVLLLAQGRMEGFGTLDELRAGAGLPNVISNLHNAEVFRDNRLTPFVQTGGKLCVPEDQTSAVVKILTTEYGCFDFQLRKADLGMIFAHYVLGVSTENL